MRVLAGVVALSLLGCSFGMRRVDPEWNGRVEPDCTSGYGVVALDALATTGAGLVATIEAEQPDGESNAALGISSAVVALAFGISTLFGEEAVKDCRAARLAWSTGGAVAAQAAETRAAPRPVVRSAPRGFFCARSPSMPEAGLCARARADCRRARSAALGAIPDLEACALVEVAWCSAADRCTPSEASCNAQRDETTEPCTAAE